MKNHLRVNGQLLQTNKKYSAFELCPQKWTFGHTKTDTYRFKEQFHSFETVMPETRYVDDVSH